MSIPEFGRVLDEDTTVEFGRVIEEKKPSKVASIGRAGAKGLLQAAIGAQEIIPLPGRGPLSPKEQLESLMQLIGEPEEGLPERFAERTAKTLPYLLGGPGGVVGKVGRGLLSSALGQATEEVGGGEVAQTVAEMVGLGLPGLGKKIAPTRAQKKGIEMLRKRGVTEKEIAPLVPTEKKAAVLGKVAAKGFRTAKAAKQTREALGNVYSQLSEEGAKLPILSSGRTQSLEAELRQQLQKMPSSVRRSIEADMQDLFSKPVKANDIMNFWQDLNSEINWKRIGGGKNRLNSLKDSLKKGIEDISPELAADFELTNEFYSKFSKISRNLQPKDLDRLIALGEMGAVLGGLLKFGPKGALPVIGSEVLRRVGSEMLVNPRLQNLTRQMTTAVKNNKIAIAKKVQEKMVEELEKSGIDLSTSKVPPESQIPSP